MGVACHRVISTWERHVRPVWCLELPLSSPPDKIYNLQSVFLTGYASFKETASVTYSCRELYDRWTSAVSIKGINL